MKNFTIRKAFTLLSLILFVKSMNSVQALLYTGNIGIMNGFSHQVFGYEIVALKDSYILVNNLNSKLTHHQDLSEAEFTVKGLLTAILMVIFMAEGKISAG